MDLSIWILIYLLVVKVCVLSRCRESLSTVANVTACPRNKDEWDCQSKKKGCSEVTQSCVKPEDFLYHCVINEFMNMTIEVCAPSATILGQKCAEFNMVGQIIQDNVYAECENSDPPCPFRYNSTDAYKYQRCYSYINRTGNDIPGFSEDTRDQNICTCDETWLIVSITFIIMWLISCGFGGALVYRYRNLSRKTLNRKPEDKSTTDQESIKPMQLPQQIDEGASVSEKTDAQDKSTTDKESIKPMQPSQQIEEGNSVTEETDDQENFWVYSIYIGDKYCGMAYSNPNSPEYIKSIGNVERIGVLMTDEGTIKEFGDKARKKYIENSADCSEYIFLDELDIESESENITEQHPIKTIEVYQNIIGYLVRKIWETAVPPAEREEPCISGSCTLCNMHYVITVPHHWKNNIKDLRAAFDRTMEGLHKVQKERLHIKLREVAISPYIHEVKASVTCLNFNVDNLIFKENTAYANLHVGSRYCNLTFLSAANSKSPDKIIVEPYRKKWKTTPEQQFVNLFKDLFTPEIFDEWKTNYDREYICLLCLFEDKKIKMCENMDENEKYDFKLSSKLLELFKEKKEGITELKDRVGGKKGVEMKDDGSTIIFSWSLLKTCFEDVKDKTQDVIKKYKQEFNDKEVRCVIMTGSYSQMKLFLYEAENTWFQELSSSVTVVIPVHIGSTYAMGAAYFFKKFPKWKLYDLVNM